ncbi:MAG: FAD-dependent thymidylate synthase [Victivallales bacterium]|jgi:thymidylate synthase (FAD)|nr:FAD-dependent thymidylate synthase [Victivallales bacterium]MBT7304405.1 FAD-dependent thymidylate synthase [Victivallales bacterium]
MSTEHVNEPPPTHARVLGGQGWVGLVDHMGDETTIVNAARVSFGKRRETMDERDVLLLKYLIENQHTSPLEHISFTFIVHCPLFIRSQWHRHRTWSYNEVSRRYTSLDLEFYVPPEVREQAETNRQASVDAVDLDQDTARGLITAHNQASLDLYNRLLDMGACREQARGVLPQNLMTTYWATVDLHNLLRFLELRDSEHAQWEIRQYAAAIKDLVKPYVPKLAKVLGW